MKKTVFLSFLPLFFFVFTACGGRNTGARPVLEIRENMFITQLNAIHRNYRRYLGATIRMEGMFHHNRWQGRDIYRVIRFVPGCCGERLEVGIEVTWDPNYPQSNQFNNDVQFPRPNDWVEAVGELRSHGVPGFPFLYIALTELNILDRRGAEFVWR